MIHRPLCGLTTKNSPLYWSDTGLKMSAKKVYSSKVHEKYKRVRNIEKCGEGLRPLHSNMCLGVFLKRYLGKKKRTLKDSMIWTCSHD